MAIPYEFVKTTLEDGEVRVERVLPTAVADYLKEDGEGPIWVKATKPEWTPPVEWTPEQLEAWNTDGVSPDDADVEAMLASQSEAAE